MDHREDILFCAIVLGERRIQPEAFLDIVRKWRIDPKGPLREPVSIEAALSDEDVDRISKIVCEGGGAESMGLTAMLDSLESEDLPDLAADETPSPPRPATADGWPEPGLPAPTGADRYEVGSEIGRGGLGRVLAAVDRILGREVAIKEMTTRTGNPGMIRRFLREGEVAGRLMHPNIVPIFDIGIRDCEDGRRPYFAMGMIRGRNLYEILHQQKTTGSREGLSRQRLLGMFQDVCLAVSYAHAYGVIHRDLKPANVMVGDFGEVFVVDWGLAKVKGQAEDAPAATKTQEPASLEQAGAWEPQAELATCPGHHTPATQPALTLDGEVLGTPQYMPPEQARGRMNEVDERSDVYSLGAILYEILTFRPPYEGSGQLNILAQVMSNEPKPPSQRVSEIRSMVSSHESGETICLGEAEAQAELPPLPVSLPDEIPNDLEEIVLKAMARGKEDRYSSAMDLYSEISRYLEGEKEAARNRERAAGKIEEGRSMLRRNAELRAEYWMLTEEYERVAAETRAFWPIERKRGKIKLNRRCLELRDSIVRTFGEASALFHAAFEFVPGLPEAREALADMYWEQYTREEKGSDRAQMILCENMVRRYDDGKYLEKMKGDGLLSVATRAYPCSCMERGRVFSPEELAAQNRYGYHPITASSLDGRPEGHGLPKLAPVSGMLLKAHSRDCRAVPLEDADVWIFRLMERDLLMAPAAPGLDLPSGRGPSIPQPRVLDELFPPGSPFRPTEGLYAGTTPIPPFRVPMGSYLLVIAMEGRKPVRVPVTVGRCAEQEIVVTLYSAREVPEGFAQVSAGKFTAFGDPESNKPGLEIETGDFFMAVHPVTCAEYAEFLNDIEAEDPGQARRRCPRSGEESGHYWPVNASGEFAVPTPDRLETEPGLASSTRKIALAETPWHDRWPVLGISWEDAVAYLHWRTTRSNSLFTLPSEMEREKTARGTDARIFAWGNELDESFCNNNQAFEGKITPVPVDDFPSDESPYGIRGLAGNSSDPCFDELGARFPAWRIVKGGSWGSSGVGIRAAYRLGVAKTSVYPPRFGVRMVLRPNL